MDGYRKKIKKKKMKSFLEAVIDIPRRTYAKGVFDDADTNNPKIKASVKAQIDKQIEEFETEYPVVKIGLIGSILTKRYRDDADLDINVLLVSASSNTPLAYVLLGISITASKKLFIFFLIFFLWPSIFLLCMTLSYYLIIF